AQEDRDHDGQGQPWDNKADPAGQRDRYAATTPRHSSTTARNPVTEPGDGTAAPRASPGRGASGELLDEPRDGPLGGPPSTDQRRRSPPRPIAVAQQVQPGLPHAAGAVDLDPVPQPQRRQVLQRGPEPGAPDDHVAVELRSTSPRHPAL